ncbi:esterase/lipase family protein [Saccharomonospora iraqiensis]|uniref:esterase/lipase family protein n=1 Tax=Saccharomonospora iraqiensis TaxID=52698 RepID=UPI000412BF1E|nr:hypothetical protein [Saccharomonospora iraqiensis]
MRRSGSRLLAAVSVVLSVLAVSVVPAHAASGPPLRTPQWMLEQALECDADVAEARRTPMILVHGTGATPEENWSAGYARALPRRGFPVCTVELPERALVDLQVSVEYVVHAIREVSRLSGREVSLIGHSQGGLHPVWALRFWPGLADRVEDAIGLASPYGGTQATDLQCRDGSCTTAYWQMRQGADYIRALRRHTPPEGVSYTSIGSRTDQLVFPAPQATSLPGARNIFVQDVCPARPVDHLAMAFDNVAFELVLDAVTHPGPADTARIPPGTCTQLYAPGMDPLRLTIGGLSYLEASVSQDVRGSHETDGEPALRRYARHG